MAETRTPAGEALLDVPAVDELVRLHLKKLFRLAFSVGLEGQANLQGDPQLLVTELLRLARIGAMAEEECGVDPATSVATLTGAARYAWSRRTR